MTDFAWRGHGVSVAAGMWALTKLDTEDAFKMAMAWVAGIAIACPYNAKFDLRHLQGEVPDVLRAPDPHAWPPRRRLHRQPGRVNTLGVLACHPRLPGAQRDPRV